MLFLTHAWVTSIWWYCREKAPEVFELLEQENPNFSEDFLQQPEISFGGAVTLSRFHHENIIVIGDAAHAMVWLQDHPFYSSFDAYRDFQAVDRMKFYRIHVSRDCHQRDKNIKQNWNTKECGL